jgi:glycosyltransferase involved in cell wall biosynthesis/SAM-dependent methyltransferase
MRILHVTAWLAPRYGGPALSLPKAAAAVCALGLDVEIVATDADGLGVVDAPTGRRVDWAGAAVTFHPRSWPRRFLVSWPLLRDVWQRSSRFDVVHIHCLYRFHTIAAVLAARHAGVPYVIQAHGSLDPWHRRRRRRAKSLYHALIEDSNLRGAAAIICTTEHEAGSIRGLGYTKPTWVIPVGIDAADLRRPASADAFLAQAGVEPGTRVVTFLSRISEKKGLPLLVEAFRDTASQFPSARLLIAGPDDEGIGRGLGGRIEELGLSGRISFVGSVGGDEKRALLQRSDVFVLPSADESFGNAVAEAMAVGCPVVISPYVALQDVVSSAGAGIVAERNGASIARAVNAILSDREMADGMAAAGMRVVDDRYSWPQVAAELERMYASVRATSARRTGQAANLVPAAEWIPREPPLVCPKCRGPLRLEPDTYECDVCPKSFAVIAGVPALVGDFEATAHDEIDHADGHHEGTHDAAAHKAEQARHFDRDVAEQFEIERPHGTPRLYRFLLGEKFHRATQSLGPHLSGATALTVCGGSGMDAEYLSRAGATVVSSDLSLGAATRAKTRSERYGLGLKSIVADLEHLPYADRSVDLVAVHDGLHHLDDPYAGVSEMARVARRWVVITEPARASVTRLAIRLGLALEREAAGNRVIRLEPSELGAYLEARGFVVLRAERYAIYYSHRPGRIFRLLSLPVVYSLARAGWRVANALLGRFGNKMVVVAERVQTPIPSTPSPIRVGTAKAAIPAQPYRLRGRDKL